MLLHYTITSCKVSTLSNKMSYEQFQFSNDNSRKIRDQIPKPFLTNLYIHVQPREL